MTSRSASCRLILRGPCPQPNRWSPLGSIGVLQGHKEAGLEGKVGMPSQMCAAIENSLGDMERPKLGMGGGF